MTTPSQYRDYLGVGELYPAQPDAYGRLALVADAALVKQSIARILDTPVGSEYMLRAFGSQVRRLIFEQNDTVLQSLLQYHISEALNQWEPRIRYRSTDFAADGPTLLCAINYDLIATGRPDTFVYPFYRENRF
jgi:phage baseplate assembly protein W